MPIRIKKDPNYQNNRKDNYPGRGNRNSGGGNNPIVYLIPMVMKLFGKNPKLILIIGAIALAWYFFGGGSTCNSPVEDMASSFFSTGASFDQAKYAATDVFEPLADNIKNPLPERVSLVKHAPVRLNQGKQGSCVGWASAYAARTILYSRETGKDPNTSAFSPSYLYNQIALDGCQGTYLPEAMKTMQSGGVAPFSLFDYDEDSCNDKPNNEDRAIARNYTIDGYERLTKGDRNTEPDMLAIKQHLANGAPVVIGMMVGGSFMQEMQGKSVWTPTANDYDQRGFGGHAMCVIGYDDYLEGGAFQIMNSWGNQWGDNGLAWVRYRDFDFFTREAFGLHPMGNADAPTGSVNKIELGIWLSESEKNVNIESIDQGLARTASVIPANTGFKIEVTNSLPCYVYVFGAEMDNSSYVLFPYTEKHSPYCGVTGTRLFPRDHVLFPDESGTEDQIALVVSAQPLDYNTFNSRMNQATGTFEDRLNSALGKNRVSAREDGGKSLKTQVDLQENGIWGAVLKISK